jgi:hypothetical protein
MELVVKDFLFIFHPGFKTPTIRFIQLRRAIGGENPPNRRRETYAIKPQEKAGNKMGN